MPIDPADDLTRDLTLRCPLDATLIARAITRLLFYLREPVRLDELELNGDGRLRFDSVRWVIGVCGDSSGA